MEDSFGNMCPECLGDGVVYGDPPPENGEICTSCGGTGIRMQISEEVEAQLFKKFVQEDIEEKKMKESSEKSAKANPPTLGECRKKIADIEKGILQKREEYLVTILQDSKCLEAIEKALVIGKNQVTLYDFSDGVESVAKRLGALCPTSTRVGEFTVSNISVSTSRDSFGLTLVWEEEAG